MNRYFSALCALALSAAMFTGCGCMNSNKQPDPTVMPTPEMTMAPTTAATTAPTTRPTTEATTEAATLPTETGMSGTEAATDSTESTGNTSRSRAPAQNG